MLQCEANNRKNKSFKIRRTITGNTFTIRDNGISHKHLLIQLASNKNKSFQDLNTSNGIILNDFVLPPLEFRPLHDCDVIKIAEETVLCVNIAHQLENANPPDARVLRTGNKRKECGKSGFDEDLVRTSDVAEKQDNDVRVSGEIMTLQQWLDQMEGVDSNAFESRSREVHYSDQGGCYQV